MVRIFADSTCDIEKDFIAEENITIIPLYVMLGDEQRLDGVNITPTQIYEWADANNTTPKTAAFSPQDAIPHIEEAKAAGDDVVHIGISTELSASCNSVRQAAEMLDYSEHVHVVDSRNLSSCQALMIREAVILRDEGKSAGDIAEAIREMTNHVRVAFVVDTLTYLHRGGRCSGVSAFFGSRLKIKPCIAVKDGSMYVKKKYRGAMKEVLVKLFDDTKEELLSSKKRDVYITFSEGVELAIVDYLIELMESLNYFENIHITPTGGVISSHCGPGTLGFLYTLDY